MRSIAEKNGLICGRCGEPIYTCDGCRNYFNPGDIIDCQMDYHYCQSCSEDKAIQMEREDE